LKTLVKFRLLFIFVVVSAILTSCEEPSIIGLDVQPQSDLMNVKFVDTLTINAVSQRLDSVRTDKVAMYLLGSINDPYFGFSSSSFITEINLPSSNIVFPTDIVVDSIVLNLHLRGFYGNDKYKNELKVNVFEIDEQLHLDSARYSNQPVVKKRLLGTRSLIPNVKDSVTVDSIKFPPSIRIKLNNNLAKEFIEAAANGHLANNKTFVDFFNGILVEAEPFARGGIIYYFDLLSGFSRMSLYYKSQGKNQIFNFVIGQKCARFNTFYHNYNSADAALKHQMQNPNYYNNDKLFLQSRGGVIVHLKFPNIKNLKKPHPIVVNKAELVLPIYENDHSSKIYPVPPRLSLATYNEKGEFVFLPDQTDPRFGGDYNKISKEYRFNITRYVQTLINETNLSDKLVVFVSGSSTRGDRLVLHGFDSVTRKPQLQITYTIVN